MKLSALALAPVALAVPLLADLNPFQWGQVQDTIATHMENAAEYVLDGLDELAGGYTPMGDDSEKTIWQHLQDDSDKYSRLVKLLKFEGEIYKELDKNDAEHQITVFAPNNDALKPPEHHHDDDESTHTLASLSHVLETEDWLMSGDKDGDKDKKRRRAIFKKILHYIILHHVLAGSHSDQELAKNSTWPTKLKAPGGAQDGLHQRIHIEKQLIPPALKLNFYIKVVSSEEAKNGRIHEIDHPLLPPASIFEEAFVAAKWLSTTTTAIQRVHATHYVEWAYDRKHSKKGKPKFWGTPLATFFAPSNDAWGALPQRLQFFLFSRFGHRALAKLLAYHYVPNSLVLTEVYHHGKHGKKKVDADATIDDDPSFKHEYEVESGLKGKKLKITAEKKQVVPIEGAVKISLKVNDHEVKAFDIPASNGAWHILDRVLCPPHKHHEFAENTWDNWEEWLPQWADEEDF